MPNRKARLVILLAVCSLVLVSVLAEGSSPSRELRRIDSLGQSTAARVMHPLSLPSVGSNVGIVGEALPDRQQVEVTIAVDPHNPNIILAGAQDLRLKPAEHRWHGYYRSIDSGKTWTSSLLPGFPGDTSPQGLASPLHGSNTTSDPVLAVDRFGDVYYAGLVFNITSNGTIGNNVLFVARYVDDGATYSGTTLITGPLFSDKEWIVTDNTGGLYDGNIYVAFDANLTRGQPFATLFTRSTDGGKTFSPPFYAPGDMTGQLPGATVDPVGTVYVSSDSFNPITNANLNYIQVSKITNGGTTLVQTVHAVDPAYWLTGPPSGAQFRAFTIPQITADSNGVYLVFDDLRQGNSNIFFTRSLDHDNTWQPLVPVNDVSTGQHFFPTIAVSDGIINVAWYDSRLNTGTAMTSLDVYFADSVNGGASFSTNLRVTDVSFNPDGVARTDQPYSSQPYFMGDYIGVTATPTTVYPIWTDNRNMCNTFDPTWGCVDQDTYTAAITVNLAPAPGGGSGRAPLQA